LDSEVTTSLFGITLYNFFSLPNSKYLKFTSTVSM